MANQKRGILAPLTDTTLIMWSEILLRLAPANVPIAIPSDTATIPAAIANSIVAANLCSQETNTAVWPKQHVKEGLDLQSSCLDCHPSGADSSANACGTMPREDFPGR